MAKGSKLSEFEKGKITVLKRVGKSQKFRRPSDTVKLLSAITWKVQISICPVGWGCRIHQLHLSWGVTPLPMNVLIWH